MDFDYKKTIELIKGGLLDPSNTWGRYLEQNPGWRETAINLTGPLLIANVVLTLIFSRITGGYGYFGYGQNFLAALVSGLVFAALGFAILVAAFTYLAGVFKGKTDWSKAFAAVSLAMIPGWVAGVLGALIPWIGWLISLAGFVLSLVFAYKLVPVTLGVPEDKRVAHFVVSLVCAVLINMVLGAAFGMSAMNRGTSFQDFGRSADSSPVFGSGMFGELERQGRLLEAAQSDQYSPPADGKLTEEQVEAYVSVLGKTRALQEKYDEEIEDLRKEFESKEESGEEPSVSDLAKIYGSVGTAVSVNNAEMEVVKTAGGNWAEHLWVKQQLRVAAIQQGQGTDAMKHNFELYKEYEEDIGLVR